MFNFIRNIGSTEIIILVIILVLLFGAGMVKRLGKTSGGVLKEMKKAKKTFTEAVSGDDNNESSKS